MAENDDPIKEARDMLNNMKKAAIDFEKTMTGVDKATREGSKQAIKDLEDRIKKMGEATEAEKRQKKEALETLKLIERQNKILTEQYQVTGRIFQEISKTGEEYKNFLFTTAAQFNVAQEIAKEYQGLTKSIGLGRQSAELLSRSFKDALPDVLEMGLKSEDLGRIYQEMADSSGRITPLSSDDAERIAAVAAGTGIMASDASNMAEAFNLMGLSAEQMEENLMETYKSAQGMGLNATKVIKTLQSNLRSMQSYSFVGGVKGMTEMAKQAVKMRLDVSDVLAMSDKFYQPEAAIEAAANLQMLGGDIAEAFGDPFETMYLARNKPEELAKKVGEMTENMMQFNEETGEYEFPAEVRMQLKAAGEQLGINTDKMIEMARQTSKIKDIKMKFNMSGLDKDAKDSIASLATFSKDRNEYVIKHDGKELGLDEINQGMAEEIIKANQSDSDNFRDIAVNTQTMSENLSNFLSGQQARAVGTIDFYEASIKEFQAPINDFKQSMVNVTESYIDKGKEMVAEMFANKDTDVIDKTMSGLGELTNLLKDKTIKTFEELTNNINIFNEQQELEENKGGGELPENPKQQDFILRSSGQVTSFTNEDDIIGAKKGGPLDKLMDKNLKLPDVASTPSKIEFGKLDISGRIEIVSPDGSAKNMDMESIKPQLIKTIVSHLNGTFRNGGVPSSKESTDYMTT